MLERFAVLCAHGYNLISFSATKCELTYFLARSFIKLIFILPLYIYFDERMVTVNICANVVDLTSA